MQSNLVRSSVRYTHYKKDSWDYKSLMALVIQALQFVMMKHTRNIQACYLEWPDKVVTISQTSEFDTGIDADVDTQHDYDTTFRIFIELDTRLNQKNSQNLRNEIVHEMFHKNICVNLILMKEEKMNRKKNYVEIVPVFTLMTRTTTERTVNWYFNNFLLVIHWGLFSFLMGTFLFNTNRR